MKKFTFKGVLDGFRSSVQAAPRGTEQEIQETLRPDHFQIKKTFRHGFPFSPTALAWDPIQKLLAIGDKGGNLRILGGPGVDAHVRHESGEAVLHAKFLINEGALVTATADDQIHLWTFRQKLPQRVQSLKFQRERITCLHLPLQSKWVHVGTERGNVHVVNIETFALSGYVINWNKAIEVTRPNHPGAVVDISDNPLDASKLLIAFETGLVVVWDLRARAAEWRGSLGTGLPGEGVRAAAWQHDGKLMTAHQDGALATWTTRSNRPASLSYPHAKANKDGKLEPCKPILRLEWKTSRTGESLVMFSGGLPTDKAGRTHSITVLNGKSTTVLEMEHAVVDFVTLCESPHTADYQEPYAIVVLLQNDLVVIDLLSPGYPCFENPYPMDIHESPVTCCSYFADCPSDLIPAFYSVGRAGNKKAAGFSDKLWPINGGEWAPASCSYSEIILTGHADGSVKFWDASAGTLQILYKLKCSKVFERRTSSTAGGYAAEEETPLAIQQLALCAESRRLVVALPHGHVVLFKFRKSETHGETHVLEIPVISDALEEETSPEAEGGRSMSFSRAGDSGESESRRSGVWMGGSGSSLRVRGAAGTGGVRRAAGFQAALVALQQGPPHPIVALTINSSYGLMAWGGERGVVVVDVTGRAVVAALPAAALYHPAPHAAALPGLPAHPADRAPRQPDRQRSPSLDQLESARVSPLSPAAEPGDDPPDKLEARRKSTTSWKTFNLKRQLSKVDLKFKSAFTVPPESNPEDATTEKRNSQFYCDTGDKPDAPESNDDSPDSDDTKPAEAVEPEDGEKSAERSELSSPLRVCSDVFERMHRELQEKRSSDVYDRMHRELQERWQERERGAASPDTSPSRPADERAPRPDNLPLFEDDGRPARPPRQKGKLKKEEDKREQRDQRLLSVPNIKYSKQESVRDLRKRQASPAPPGSFAGSLMRRFRILISRLCKRNEQTDEEQPNVEVVQVPHIIDKLDSSFSRSRSSSMSSLENISQEGVQCLAFADSYTKKSDPTLLLPTLWIGTTLGSVLTMMINLPEPDLRPTQPVVVSTAGGPIFRLKGSILTMSFLDCNGALIPYSYESWRDDSKDVRERRERTPTKQGSSSSGSRMSPTPGASEAPASGDRQFVVIASEKQARVVALPSQNCVYRQQIVDTDFVVKAEIVSLKDSVCLVNYLSTGHLVAYSLPSLRPLVDVDFLPLSELSFQTQTKQRGIVDPMLSIWGQQLIVNEDTDQIAKTFCFSNRGHGLFLASPTEIQKFTIDAEFCQQLNEMLGELFLPRDMPEPPKESFFRGLFGGGSRPLDREELFGEATSGKPSRAVAKHIPGPNENLQQLGTRASTAASEVSRAHQLVLERGDKLSQLEDRTERMHSQAAEFSTSAHQLMLKYKDKKWYQL
ncbi:syntaxin-binding protein 5 isoform X2 [Pectinophora gossypiella]|uniref:syntaxin-binding protein 5 isoform X2 n=1 Tax=Pectinophora gossypiella TaxID=13191 RepID=UPI00214F101B|nr:syntaxin-binding protein 5 isoform X2 [Pectinophora gossypiella]